MASMVGLRERRMLVAGLCTAQFMLILDVVVIYVALPTISRDLPIADFKMHPRERMSSRSQVLALLGEECPQLV